MGAMAIGMYVVPDWGFLKSKITSYSADCEVPVVNGRCPKYLFANTPVTYKVSTSDQSVIYWVNGFPPSRLANCAVASRTSWKCEYPDKSATMGFQDGTFFSYSDGNESDFVKDHDAKQYPLSRLEYLRACNKTLTGTNRCSSSPRRNY